MAEVRGKFRVSKVSTYNAEGNHADIELTAQYSDNPEDNSYSKATPSGHISMAVTNPDVITVLTPGKYFYVDFTEVTATK